MWFHCRAYALDGQLHSGVRTHPCAWMIGAAAILADLRPAPPAAAISSLPGCHAEWYRMIKVMPCPDDVIMAALPVRMGRAYDPCPIDGTRRIHHRVTRSIEPELLTEGGAS